MRERVDLKSPVRENRPPGSVRGASGNRRPYLDTLAWNWLYITTSEGFQNQNMATVSAREAEKLT
jgi:hypothetical protein